MIADLLWSIGIRFGVAGVGKTPLPPQFQAQLPTLGPPAAPDPVQEAQDALHDLEDVVEAYEDVADDANKGIPADYPDKITACVSEFNAGNQALGRLLPGLRVDRVAYKDVVEQVKLDCPPRGNPRNSAEPNCSALK